MLLVLLKATLLFSLALGCLPLIRRASAMARHLICACAMAGALLLPLTMLVPPGTAPIRVSAITFFATSGATLAAPAWTLSKILLSLWAAGVVFFLLRLAIGHWRLAIILRTATPADGFFISDVPTPIVAGLLRPVILMPRSACVWPLSQRTAALKHEQAHVDRHDLWTNLIAYLACAIYWFHPLAWALARRQRQEQETACDDAVLCSGLEPASYAEALIATALQTAPGSLIGCRMTQKTLKSRIVRLFESDLARTSSSATMRRAAVVFAVAIAAIALIDGNPTARAADSGPIYKVGGNVSRPQLILKVDPVYTNAARNAKLSGEVLLHLVVDSEGHARDILVVKGLGMGLDEKAVAAVKKWKFAPGRKDGTPVSTRATIQVNFRLL